MMGWDETIQYILSEDGTPVACESLLEWAAWYADRDQHVARDERDGVIVSTVFLGIDHNWRAGPPLLFETMIFGGENDEYQRRYATRGEAEAGHKEACALAWPDSRPVEDDEGPSVCEFYRMKAAEAVQEWDGQENADLLKLIAEKFRVSLHDLIKDASFATSADGT